MGLASRFRTFDPERAGGQSGRPTEVLEGVLLSGRQTATMSG
jgi:hypothetical protein